MERLRYPQSRHLRVRCRTAGCVHRARGAALTQKGQPGVEKELKRASGRRRWRRPESNRESQRDIRGEPERRKAMQREK